MLTDSLGQRPRLTDLLAQLTLSPHSVLGAAFRVGTWNAQTAGRPVLVHPHLSDDEQYKCDTYDGVCIVSAHSQTSRALHLINFLIMKFASFAAAALAFALPAFAQVSTTLSYDTTYDDASLSLTAVACSDGVNGLMTKGYTTLGSLPTFPNLGGVYTVTGWDSSSCGSCYEVTYGSTTIAVLAVDVALEGFNLSEEAMNTLTGGQAVDLGRVDVTAVQVAASVCGL